MNAAYGVDGIGAREYAEDLTGNIRNLVERLKRKTYRARLVRRHWIPIPDGRQRPLGIPVVEDKLLQLAVTRILEAIYEQDFLRCSPGVRGPGCRFRCILEVHVQPGALRRQLRGP